MATRPDDLQKFEKNLAFKCIHPDDVVISGHQLELEEN
jgi:hypothetical protein